MQNEGGVFMIAKGTGLNIHLACVAAQRLLTRLLHPAKKGVCRRQFLQISPLQPWSEAGNKCDQSWLGRADSSTFPVELLKSSRETFSIWHPILLEKNSTVRG